MYSKEGILAQVAAAFGQGTGAVRIAQSAILALTQRYEPQVDEKLLEVWEHEGVQVLERIRAMGRLASELSTREGGTAIQPEHVMEACRTVERASGTLFCPRDAG